MLFSFSRITSLQIIFIAGSMAIPWSESRQSPFKNTHGFSDPTFSTSSRGFANCLSGQVTVLATTYDNVNLLFSEPPDQYAATASFVDFLKTNSSVASQVNGGPAEVSQTFNIYGKLCLPKKPSGSGSTVQVLTHGIGFSHSYWDFAQGYSFIDIAAREGYATFSFDRLGVGASDHPDPIQIVQASIQIEIIHTLVSQLRGGQLAGETFEKVVGVGHSFGSIQSVGIVAKYPEDFDAVVLTGFSTNATALPLTFADFNSAIASQNQPDRFGHLPNGYLVFDNPIANQVAFFSYPNFDSSIFLSDDANKQTFTYGEFFTITSAIAPSLLFKGPVDVVIGEFDFIFAQGNAYYPVNQAALVQPALFPNACKGSQSYVVPGVGHAINLHHGAEKMFDQVQKFVKDNGF